MYVCILIKYAVSANTKNTKTIGYLTQCSVSLAVLTMPSLPGSEITVIDISSAARMAIMGCTCVVLYLQ